MGLGRWTRTWRGSGVGCHRGVPALRAVGTASRARILLARREWHSARMGRTRAREYGDAHAQIFRESRRARVRRALLPAGRGTLPPASRARRRRRSADCELAARARARVAVATLRVRARGDAR